MSIQGLNNLQISPISGQGTKDINKNALNNGEFAQALEGLLKEGTQKGTEGGTGELTIKFSNHAVERMRSRGIHYSPDTLQKLESVVAKAKDKGAKETLIIAGDSAMIVNIENKTVVTVMDKNMLKENIFTNIDAAAIV
jgi:flagellar operon protein